MRDPERIPKILFRLGMLWEKYPDLRLAQLIENFHTSAYDPYNLEDEKFIGELEAFYEGIPNSSPTNKLQAPGGREHVSDVPHKRTDKRGKTGGDKPSEQAGIPTIQRRRIRVHLD